MKMEATSPFVAGVTERNFEEKTVSSFPGYGFERKTQSTFNETEDEYSYNDYPEYSYDYYPEGNIQPFLYPIYADWERILRGHVDLTIALITICTNIIMASVFIFRSSRSPTTVLLTTLAVSDSLICICRMEESIYFNILDHHETVYITYRWCIISQVFRYINQCFRFTSNWITVILGFQRCISVVMPFRVKTICSMKVTCIVLLTLIPAAIILNVYEMFAIEIVELKIFTTADYNESLPSGCYTQYSETVKSTLGDPDRSKVVFYIFNTIFARVLPVLILTVTSIILAVALKKGSRSMTQYDANIQQARNIQFKKITIIVFAILVIFLIAELQDGTAFIIYIIELVLDKKYQILSKEQTTLWDTVASTLSLLSYACNFWIFFMMSNQFRSALINMLRHPFKKIGLKWAFDTEEPGTSETNMKGLRKSTDDQSLL
ncbi:hypothetical protein FSP39_003440 [Pinctada imbricata]|uniref:G-protein coupled receptors family 1 profile domain-containing protein n=1 Tax=Pinctada imbricata TaxID=66713 RepID=A0AA89C3K7_PINIB|nr:hypothetical protein FSP39_003440 [Pinctada imbricata]